MTFGQFRIFLAVIEHGSFTRAADALYMSQPAVSQHIQCLERELGQQLFCRKGRTPQLTSAGKELVPHARRLVEVLDQARQALAALAKNECPSLSIGATGFIGDYLLPEVIGRYHAQHPNVQLSLSLGQTPDLVARLLDGELDLALTADLPTRHQDRLSTQLYRTGELILAAPATHPWTQRSELPLDELLSEPLIVMANEDQSQVFVRERLAAAGVAVDRLAAAFELGSMEGVVRAIRAGLGVGFVSVFVIEPDLRLGTVRRIPLQGLTLRRPLWILTLSGEVPGHVQHMIDHLHATDSGR